MNAKNFVLLLFQGILLAAPLVAADLTVSRISVTGTETTDPELVRQAFLEVKVGDTLNEADLVLAAALVRDRLLNLGYFSTVDVVVVRSKSKPGTAALVAEVAEGERARYGGGPIWGRAGAVNLDGKGQDVDLWLGWNRQAAAWSGRWSNLPGWTLGAEGGNRPLKSTGLDGVKREDHLIGASVSVSREWGWGWASGAEVGANGRFDDAYQNPLYRADPLGWLQWSRRTVEFSPVGVLVRAQSSAAVPGNLYRLGTDLRTTWALGAGLKAAFRLVAQTQSGGSSPRDDLVLTDLGLRRVYDPLGRGQSAVWASAELRWQALKTDLLGFTTLTLEPALVADFSPDWSAGGALRLFIGAPVSLPLQLEATYDNEHRLWWGFSASPPF